MRAQQKFNHHPTKQAGVITILAVLMMLSLFTFVAVVADTGRLYLEKRSLQKNADLAAMETALIYCRDQSLDVEAMSMADMYVLSASRNDFKGNDTNSSIAISRTGNAVTVNLVHTVPASLFAQLLPTGDNEVDLKASATAKACEPTAQLAVRSKLAELDSNQSLLLNPIFGGLLGTTLNLSAADWNGILDANINLLSFLDGLSSELNLEIGNYNGILTTDISLADLIDVSIQVLNASGGSTASVTALNTLAASIPAFTPPIQLGEILNLQDDAEEADLDSGINLFSLIQSSIQLATNGNKASVDLPIGIPGLASVSVKAKIIEPQQLSPVGNPDADEIYVRSAQVRTLVSVNLGSTTQIVNDLTNAISPFLSPVTDFLNTAGYSGLNGIFNLLATIACGGFLQPECPIQKITYMEVLKDPLQISIDAGEAEAFLSPTQLNQPVYVCDGADKELYPNVKTALVHARIGKMVEADVFSTAGTPTVDPFPIVEIGYKRARAQSCILIIGCSGQKWEQTDGTWLLNAKSTAKKNVIAGLGLRLDADIVGAEQPQSFTNPNLPELKDPCLEENPGCYQSIAIGNRKLNGADIDIVAYASSGGGILGSLLGGNPALISGLVSDLIDALIADDGLIAGIVNAIIDPDSGLPLLDILGADLAGADIGAALTCENDKVRLVN